MTPDIPLKERILFQNEACMVINKLPGESSESNGTELFPAMPAGAKAEESVQRGSEKQKFPIAVHRLDVPVSGCLLLAKTPGAAAFLNAAFASHDGGVEKLYWAIIEMPQADTSLPAEAELVHWLYENRKLNKAFALPWSESQPPPGDRRSQGQIPPGRMPSGRMPSGRMPRQLPPKKAVLRYRLKGRGDHYLFMEIDLVTGRHHQIRAQLAALGLHIKGDLKYGARRSDKTGSIRLHAYSLAFPDPLKPGETIRVKAMPPLMDPLWTAFAEG